MTAVLQSGVGPVDGSHYLRSTPETVLWGRLPCAATPPVLRVASGATVTVDTVSHEGVLEDQGRDPAAFFARYGVPRSEVLTDAVAIAASGLPRTFGVDGPHVVTGPVWVDSAEPGDLLRVDILSALPRVPYGVVSTRHGKGALAGEYPAGPPPAPTASVRTWESYRTTTAFCRVDGDVAVLPFGSAGRAARFPLAPFPGILSVGVPGSTAAHSTPPGHHGGNLDVSLLSSPGASLYLPVLVPGALFATGDPHFAQGDGEVALTALEAPLRLTVRLTVLRSAAARAAVGVLREPFVETDRYWVPLGLHSDLREAMRRCVRAAVAFLATQVGMAEAVALAYLSAAADFSVSQVVDGVQGIHCRIRKSDFA